MTHNPYQTPHADVSDLEPRRRARIPPRRVLLAVLVSPWAVLPSSAVMLVIWALDGTISDYIGAFLRAYLELSAIMLGIAYVMVPTYGLLSLWGLRRLEHFHVPGFLLAGLVPCILAAAASFVLLPQVSFRESLIILGYSTLFAIPVAALFGAVVTGVIGRRWGRGGRPSANGEKPR